jgi:catechol 2,3-dioxygenase-like lactoylglutathione lyase family enzyme
VHLHGKNANLELFRQPDTSLSERVENPAGDFSKTGLKHFCMEVEDIEQELQRLAKVDIKPVTGMETARSLAGARYIFFRDPDGNGVELLEPGKE